MFGPHELSEIMSVRVVSQQPGAFQASAASRVRGARGWSFAGAADGLTAENAGLRALRLGEFTEGASGHRGFPISLGNL